MLKVIDANISPQRLQHQRNITLKHILHDLDPQIRYYAYLVYNHVQTNEFTDGQNDMYENLLPIIAILNHHNIKINKLDELNKIIKHNNEFDISCMFDCPYDMIRKFNMKETQYIKFDNIIDKYILTIFGNNPIIMCSRYVSSQFTSYASLLCYYNLHNKISNKLVQEIYIYESCLMGNIRYIKIVYDNAPLQITYYTKCPKCHKDISETILLCNGLRIAKLVYDNKYRTNIIISEITYNGVQNGCLHSKCSECKENISLIHNDSQAEPCLTTPTCPTIENVQRCSNELTSTYEIAQQTTTNTKLLKIGISDNKPVLIELLVPKGAFMVNAMNKKKVRVNFAKVERIITSDGELKKTATSIHDPLFVYITNSGRFITNFNKSAGCSFGIHGVTNFDDLNYWLDAYRYKFGTELFTSTDINFWKRFIERVKTPPPEKIKITEDDLKKVLNSIKIPDKIPVNNTVDKISMDNIPIKRKRESKQEYKNEVEKEIITVPVKRGAIVVTTFKKDNFGSLT